jgi:glycerate kinase
MSEGNIDQPPKEGGKSQYQVIEFAKQADQTVKGIADSIVKAKGDIRKCGIDTIEST